MLFHEFNYDICQLNWQQASMKQTQEYRKYVSYSNKLDSILLFNTLICPSHTLAFHEKNKKKKKDNKNTICAWYIINYDDDEK